jgi:GAF domain-containing protein
MASDLDRLRLLYDLNRRLSTFTDLDELVRYVTRRARELLRADGCALLLFDARRNELYFPIASQREGRAATPEQLAEIRFPADRGVAGAVFRQGEPVLVTDARADTRFYPGVDQQTGLETRSILCAPLRTRSGTIGVIEVINPAERPTQDDLQFLDALAADVGVAHEKAELYGRLRAEALGLRRLSSLMGLGLLLAGVLFGSGAYLTLRARALPIDHLILHPGFLIGVLCALMGGVLVGVARGWLVTRVGPAVP